MKIAIDKRPLVGGDKVRGVGEYTRNLITALTQLSKKGDFVLDEKEYDIVHYPYFHPFFNTVPFFKSKKTVVTIHDVIPLLYPTNYPPGIKGRVRFFIQKLSLKTVDVIITDTETSKKDIVRLLDVPSQKVFPIHLAPAKHFKKLPQKVLKRVKKKYELPNKFVLYVGDVNYNKNVRTLVNACGVAKIDLVVAGKHALEVDKLGTGLDVLSGPSDYFRFLLGKPHPELAHYQSLLDAIRKNGKVKRLGYIPKEDLVAIYNLATVYCQPSFYEGFGLPVLEAMACGTPVVSSKTQALVEITEDAAIFFDPKDEKEPANILRKVIDDKYLQKRLSQAGLKNVEKFSWEKTAKKTLEVYKKVYAQK